MIPPVIRRIGSSCREGRGQRAVGISPTVAIGTSRRLRGIIRHALVAWAGMLVRYLPTAAASPKHGGRYPLVEAGSVAQVATSHRGGRWPRLGSATLRPYQSGPIVS